MNAEKSFVFLLSFITINAFSQPNTFLKIYYSYPHHHVSFCVAEDGDGGYITEFRGQAGYDDLLIKTDSVGNELLIDTLCSNGGISLKKIHDSNYVFVTTTETLCSNVPTNGTDIKIYKANKYIDTLWTSIVGTSYDENVICILQLRDSTFLVGGFTSGFDNLFKIDSDGNFISSHLIPMEWIFSIIEDTEGNLVFCGYAGDGVPNSWAVVKTDSSATNILWAKYYGTSGGLGDQYFADLIQLPDSSYLLGGVSPDFLFMKVNKNTGDSLWSNNSFGFVYSIDTVSNGKYIAAGSAYFNLLNDTGGIILTKLFLNISIKSIRSTSDGGFIAAGYYYQGIQMWPMLLKTDSLGNFTTDVEEFNIKVLNYSLYPNPLITQSKLEFGNTKREQVVFILYDIAGREIERKATTSDHFIIHRERKSPGLYLFKLVNTDTGEINNGKIVIE